jgi:hypothetical protein
MNMLITGGLLLLALVAIVGAVLLGIGEERAEKQREAEQAAQLLQVTETPQSPEASLLNAAPETPALHAASEAHTTGQLLAEREMRTPYPARHNGQFATPAPAEAHAVAILQGQFHAITGELRVLGQRAGELEQRLHVLSEVLESLTPPDEATAPTPLPVSSEGNHQA